MAHLEIVELTDFTAEAHVHGLRCSISLSNGLVAMVQATLALSKFRELLAQTNGDPQYDIFRAVSLRGEAAKPYVGANWRGSMMKFVEDCREGHPGVSESGTIAAIAIGRALMICQLGFGIVQRERNPQVVLSTLDQANFWVEPIAMRRSMA